MGFLPGFEPVVRSVMWALLSFGLFSSTLYYCTASRQWRIAPLCLFLLLFFMLLALSAFYLSSIVVYLLTRLLSCPSELIEVVSPVVSVATYVVAVVHTSLNQRDALERARLSKSELERAMLSAGLAYYRITMSIVVTVVILLFVLALL